MIWLHDFIVKLLQHLHNCLEHLYIHLYTEETSALLQHAITTTDIPPKSSQVLSSLFEGPASADSEAFLDWNQEPNVLPLPLSLAFAFSSFLASLAARKASCALFRSDELEKKDASPTQMDRPPMGEP